MTILRLIGNLARRRLDAAKAPKSASVRTLAPLGLHQGSGIEVSPVALVLPQAAGSIFPAGFDTTQVVTAVGSFSLFGRSVKRSYLSDGRSFIETVADRRDPAKVEECRLWTSHLERHPANASEWAFLLADEDGLIGWPLFQLDGVDGQPILYPRLWSPGNARVQPVPADETVADEAGGAVRVRHRTMLYARRLGTAADAPTEYVSAAAVDDGEGASLCVLLGLDLTPGTLSVYPSAR